MSIATSAFFWFPYVCLPPSSTYVHSDIIKSRKMHVEANLTKLVLLQVGLELGVIAFGKFLPRFMSHFLPFFNVTKPLGLLLECSIWELHSRQSIYKETQDIFGRNDLKNHMCVQFLTQVPIPGGAKLWEAKQVGFLGGSTVKNLQCRRCRRHAFDSWVGKIPWRRHGNPLQYPCLENPIAEEPDRLLSIALHRVGPN